MFLLFLWENLILVRWTKQYFQKKKKKMVELVLGNRKLFRTTLKPVSHPELSRGYTSDFLLAMAMRFFFFGNCRVPGARWWLQEWQSLWFCREKFNSLNFSRFFFCRHRSTCARVATRVIFNARRRRDNFQQKSQAKNCSCSRGFSGKVP